MNLNKVITVIVGFSQCRDFNYACFIAENLSKLLPNFSVKKITKNFSDWKDWLKNTCETHGWSHNESPIVWREAGLSGSNCTYIGGVSEFKIFIYNYYGIDAVLSETEYMALNLDYSLTQSLELKEKSEDFDSNLFHVTISGAGCSVCPDLVAQLATMKEISRNGIKISLYDTPGHFFKMKDIIKDATAIGGELRSVKILEDLFDGLKNCDILIILDQIDREDQESTQEWLSRNYEATKNVAKQIDMHGSSDLKVIFCSTGPTCFCANVLLKECTILDKHNIIVISAHYGLEWVYEFVKSLNIDCEGIGCPPVWGFLGINQYVDMCHTVQKSCVYIPNKRALTSSANSTLPLGMKYSELRWLLYLTFNKKPHELAADRKAICMYQVGRAEDFQKCKAICDLLKLWYQKDDSKIGDEIINLGILSDGTFNITKNIFFSQPVYLKILDDDSRNWVPCADFPVPSDSSSILMNFVETAKIILENMNLLID